MLVNDSAGMVIVPIIPIIPVVPIVPVISSTDFVPTLLRMQDLVHHPLGQTEQVADLAWLLGMEAEYHNV